MREQLTRNLVAPKRLTPANLVVDNIERRDDEGSGSVLRIRGTDDQGQTWIVPDYINIEAFPPLGGKVTPRDARLLRLVRRPLRESEAGWYVNELRSRRTFEVIRLKAGEMIWASESGEVRYLDSCGNRISFLLAHHVTEIVNAPKPSPTTQQVDNRGWLLRRWDNYWYGPHWWYRTWVHVAPNGGTIKVTAGDITVDATGTGVADIAR